MQDPTAAHPGPRAVALVGAVIGAAFLVVPATAAAHGAGTPRAVDAIAAIDAIRPPQPDLHVRVLGGDRRLWLRADGPRAITVLGDGGEPFLVLSRSGIAVNDGSPLATAAGLGRGAPSFDPSAPPRWRRIRDAGAGVAWHEHRLAAARFTIALRIAGRPVAIVGSRRRGPAPDWRPWLAGAIAASAAIALAGRHLPPRGPLPAALALAALAATSTSTVGDVLADPRSPAVAAMAALAAALLVVGAAVAIARSRGQVRAIAVAVTAVLGAYGGLGSLPAFVHPFVLSALPGTAVRLLAAIALAGGAGAAVLAGRAVLQPTAEAVHG